MKLYKKQFNKKMSQLNLNNSVKDLVEKARGSGNLGNVSSLSGVAVSNNSKHEENLYSKNRDFSENRSNQDDETSSKEDDRSPIHMSSLSKSLSNSLKSNTPSNVAPTFLNPLSVNKSQFNSSQSQNNNLFGLSQQSISPINPLLEKSSGFASNSQSSFGTSGLFPSQPTQKSPENLSNSQSSFGTSGLFSSPQGVSHNSTLSNSQIPSFNASKSYEPFNSQHKTEVPNNSLSSKIEQLKSLSNMQKGSQSASDRLAEISPSNEKISKEKIGELRRISNASSKRFSSKKEPEEYDYSKTDAKTLIGEMKHSLEKTSSLSAPSLTSSGSLSVADRIKKLREQSSSVQSNNSSLSKNRANSPAKSVGYNMEHKMSHTEEQFSIPDVLSSEIDRSEKPKVTGKEDVLAPHMEVFKKYGITIDKIFNDKDSDIIYLDAYTKVGVNFIIEIANKKGVTLYLNDGHILEKHIGDEFDISKKILEEECEALGTCGLFSQSGDKLVIASKKDTSVHKTSYVITSLDSEKSLIESDKVVSLPVIKFEQLEQDESCVMETILLVDYRYHEYCKRAADEALIGLRRAILDFDMARASCIAYLDDNSVANQNFEYRHSVALRNLVYYSQRGDEESISKVAAGRKELFEDLQKTVSISRELSKSIEHASKLKSLVDEKILLLRGIGSKYV